VDENFFTLKSAGDPIATALKKQGMNLTSFHHRRCTVKDGYRLLG